MTMSSSLRSVLIAETQTLTWIPMARCIPSLSPARPPRKPRSLPPLSIGVGGPRIPVVGSGICSLASKAQAIPFAGAEDALVGFITGKRKATEVAHSVWSNIVQKGDVVIDATCGNGHDTLALLRMVAGESGTGCVYGMDIQQSALNSTSSLLEEYVNEDERKLCKLFLLCHSKMKEMMPKDTPVRLVAFNLGYLPGGDKEIITESQTTLLALQSASKILRSGGLISLVVYVGHDGGREEIETVQSFASSLPVESWVTCKLQILNRPTSPVLVLLHKR